MKLKRDFAIIKDSETGEAFGMFYRRDFAEGIGQNMVDRYNSHEELVEALKTVLSGYIVLVRDMIEANPAEPGEEEIDPEKDPAVINARAALALAKGEE